MTQPLRRPRIGLTVVVAVVALAASGCLQNPNPAGGAGGGGLGGFVDGGTADGDKKVTILGAFGGAEADAFEASLAKFEQDSGIDVQYTPDSDFTTTVKQKVNSGDAPDIGLFPQPGGLLEFAGQGKVNPIDTYLDYEALDSTLVPGMLDAARYRGRVYGAPMRLAVKSLVWYPKPSWEDAGYSTEPKSIQDLASVTDKVKADGVAPWCMGWESAQDTGWVGTDWIEELVLRMWGPDVYDQWVAHEIPFNDERIVKSFDEFGKLAKTEGNVLGGVRGILNTPFGETMNPAFGADPRCYLMRQGNFASGFLPADVQSDLDAKVGVFVYPPFEGGYEGQAILGGGDIASLFNGNDDDAKAVMEFITSDTVRRRVGQGRRVAVTAPVVRREQLRQRHHPADGEDRLRRRRLPVRRLRPDAQGGRLRHLLDRHGAVDQRQVVPGGHGPDRGVLAEGGRAVVMSNTTTAPPPPTVTDPGPEPVRGPDPGPSSAQPIRVLVGLVGMVLIVWFVANLFLGFAFYPGAFFDNRILIGALALIAGVGGAAGLFYFLNMFVEGLPRRLSEGLIPYAFLLPSVAFIGLMLIYPTIQTINYSFANADSTAYVGFANYRSIFSDPQFWQSIFNNILWIIVVPAVTVVFGVVVAVLADKLTARGEKLSKSFIFLPMAISFVGASAIWGLIYAYDNPGSPQTGLLNAVWVAFGGEPQTWLNISTARLNSFLMMLILIWLQVGFAMILLSSAIKGVPEDTIEAARIDGASEVQIFFKVVIPQIKGTIITVFITVLILVLKVFDIVYVMTNGRFNSNVIANLFFNELFANSQAGRATAIVVILLLAVIPVLIYQVRHFRAEEANR